MAKRTASEMEESPTTEPSSPPCAVPPPVVVAGSPTAAASVLDTASKRCFHVCELIDLLSPSSTPLSVAPGPPPSPPPSGALFLYDRTVTRNFKQDGHDWVRKRVSSRRASFKVREDDVKLRLNGEFRVAGWYARSASSKTFRRRTYYLLDPEDLKPHGDWVLVHYLDAAEALRMTLGDAARVFSSPSAPSTFPAAADGQGGETSSRQAIGHGDADAAKATVGNYVGDCKSVEKTTMGGSSGKDDARRRDSPISKLGHDDDVTSGRPPTTNTLAQDDSHGRGLQSGPAITVDGRFDTSGDCFFRKEELVTGTLPPSKSGSALSDFQACPKLNDQDVAKEWHSLTKRERDNAIADLYGGAAVDASLNPNDVPEESNPFKDSVRGEVEKLKMSLLEDEIDRIPPHTELEKASFLEAMRQCPSIALSTDVKLQFLRCDNDSPEAAARRLIKYWNMRVELFGSDGAFSPLTLERAAPSNEWGEEAEGRLGFARLLPGTDASGRVVIFLDNTARVGAEADLRSLWYMAHAALEDECARRNGVIYILFNTPPIEHTDRQAQLNIIRSTRDILPLRLRAIHVCHYNKTGAYLPVADAANFSLGKHLRARTVYHECSDDNLLLHLAEFGISRHQLPEQVGGTFSNDQFRQWLLLRRSAGR